MFKNTYIVVFYELWLNNEKGAPNTRKLMSDLMTSLLVFPGTTVGIRQNLEEKEDGYLLW